MFHGRWTDLGDDVGQGRVAEEEPPARRDTVGLVLELGRFHFVKVAEAAKNTIKSLFKKTSETEII